MIILIHAEKVFQEIHDPFITKILNKLGIKGTFQPNKDCKGPISNIILNGKKLNAFSPRSGKDKYVPYQYSF